MRRSTDTDDRHTTLGGLIPEKAANDASWFASRGLMSRASFKIYKKEAKKRATRDRSDSQDVDVSNTSSTQTPSGSSTSSPTTRVGSNDTGLTSSLFTIDSDSDRASSSRSASRRQSEKSEGTIPSLQPSEEDDASPDRRGNVDDVRRRSLTEYTSEDADHSDGRRGRMKKRVSFKEYDAADEPTVSRRGPRGSLERHNEQRYLSVDDDEAIRGGFISVEKMDSSRSLVSALGTGFSTMTLQVGESSRSLDTGLSSRNLGAGTSSRNAVEAERAQWLDSVSTLGTTGFSSRNVQADWLDDRMSGSDSDDGNNDIGRDKGSLRRITEGSDRADSLAVLYRESDRHLHGVEPSLGGKEEASGTMPLKGAGKDEAVLAVGGQDEATGTKSLRGNTVTVDPAKEDGSVISALSTSWHQTKRSSGDSADSKPPKQTASYRRSSSSTAVSKRGSQVSSAMDSFATAATTQNASMADTSSTPSSLSRVLGNVSEDIEGLYRRSTNASERTHVIKNDGKASYRRATDASESTLVAKNSSLDPSWYASKGLMSRRSFEIYKKEMKARVLSKLPESKAQKLRKRKTEPPPYVEPPTPSPGDLDSTLPSYATANLARSYSLDAGHEKMVTSWISSLQEVDDEKKNLACASVLKSMLSPQIQRTAKLTTREVLVLDKLITRLSSSNLCDDADDGSIKSEGSSDSFFREEAIAHSEVANPGVDSNTLEAPSDELSNVENRPRNSAITLVTMPPREKRTSDISAITMNRSARTVNSSLSIPSGLVKENSRHEESETKAGGKDKQRHSESTVSAITFSVASGQEKTGKIHTVSSASGFVRQKSDGSSDGEVPLRRLTEGNDDSSDGEAPLRRLTECNDESSDEGVGEQLDSSDHAVKPVPSLSKEHVNTSKLEPAEVLPPDKEGVTDSCLNKSDRSGSRSLNESDRTGSTIEFEVPQQERFVPVYEESMKPPSEKGRVENGRAGKLPSRKESGDILTDGMTHLSMVMLVNLYGKLREMSILGHASVKLVDIDCNSHQSLARKKEMKRIGLLKPKDESQRYLDNTRSSRFIVRSVLDEHEMFEASNQFCSLTQAHKATMEYDASLLQDLNLGGSSLEVVWFSDRHPKDLIYCICADTETSTVTVIFHRHESAMDRIRNSYSLEHPNPIANEKYEGNDDYINLRASVSEEILRPRRDTGLTTLDEIATRVDAIGKELTDRGKYNLSVTGHSLAGGIATVVGFYLAANPKLELASGVRVFTYGSSRSIGCRTFQHTYKHLEMTGRLLRANFTNSYELSFLPLWDQNGFWYKNVGMHIRLHENSAQPVDITYNQEAGLSEDLYQVKRYTTSYLSGLFRGKKSPISDYQHRMKSTKEYWERANRSNGKRIRHMISLDELYHHAMKHKSKFNANKEVHTQQKSSSSSIYVWILVSIFIFLEIALLLRMTGYMSGGGHQEDTIPVAFLPPVTKDI